MTDEVLIKVLGADLKGALHADSDSKGLVIFAHGSGSGKNSPRNLFVASELNKNGIGTLLFDLLTEKEDTNVENRFNIDLLTDRLVGATKWSMENERTKKLPIGYFGASTGAAAALSAAAYWGSKIKAVVSRGGRPDLAGEVLDLVESPTLLIVGSLDKETIDRNRQAYIHLGCEKKTEVIAGAGHLFEEEGALEKVSDLAIKWFLKHFEQGLSSLDKS